MITLRKIYYTFTGHPSRINYWSLSSIADGMRKVHGISENLPYGTTKDFREWDEAAKKASPVGFWITDVGLDHLQDIVMFIPDVYHNVRRKLHNIFISKSHVISTGLTPGGWYEYDTRMEEGLFNIIVEFVEYDQAVRHDRAAEWNNNPENDDEDREIFETIKDRREAGLAHLDWEIALTDPYTEFQSERAKEIKEIYLWIKDIRPNRMDPHDHKEWSEYCDSKVDILDPIDDDNERVRVRRLIKEVNNIEQKYKAEDTEMLIRIIKIREGLWT